MMGMMSAEEKWRNKMTTVKQLIEWLQTIPEDSIVDVEHQLPDGDSVMTDLYIEDCYVHEHRYLKDKLVVNLRGGE
jgi:hypothetical protein